MSDRSPEASPAPCPKCGAPRDPSGACPCCGLIYAYWTEATAATVVLDTTASSMWQNALDNWEHEPAHKAFIAYCDTVGRLDWAGRSYRDQQQQRGDDPMIDQALARILALGQARLANPGERRAGNRALRNVVVAVLVIAILAVLTFTGIKMLELRGEETNTDPFQVPVSIDASNPGARQTAPTRR